MEPGPLVQKVIKNKRHFLAYNQAKTDACMRSFGEEDRAAFILVPYFLNYNLPLFFPEAPANIRGYRANRITLDTVEKYFHAGTVRTAEQPSLPQIDFLSLMGSIGTVAYNDQSDFDYWCCLDKNLPPSEEIKLLEKIAFIEDWCAHHLGVEVHIFTTTAEKLLRNDFGEVSKESTGSSFGKVIKAEYFRCSIHIAGHIPYWWVTPLEVDDAEYRKTVFAVKRSKHPIRHELCDVGNVDRIPPSEFLSSGLWQLNKGVFSPFKSLLKMALLVVYADSQTEQMLLCNRIKQQVFHNHESLRSCDSYQYMVDLVLNYYDKKDKTQANLIRECFFLKVRPQVTRWLNMKSKPVRDIDGIMLEYCNKWQWKAEEIRRLEEFELLSVNEAMELRKSIRDYMSTCLNYLSEKSEGSWNKGHQSDMMRMAARIKAVFQQKRGTVEWVYPPFDHFLHDRNYTLRSLNDQTNPFGFWKLFKGDIGSAAEQERLARHSHIRSYSRLQDLIAFMLFNNLISSKTQLHIDCIRPHDFKNNVLKLANIYKNHFDCNGISSLDSYHFSSQPNPDQWIISVNLVPVKETSISFYNNDHILMEGDGQSSENSDTISPWAEAAINGPKQDISHLDSVLKNIMDNFEYDEENGDPGLKPMTLNEEDKQNLIDELNIIGGKRKIKRYYNKRLAQTEDLLNAGEDNATYAMSAELFERNTWGEVVCDTYNGSGWLTLCLTRILEICSSRGNSTHSSLRLHVGDGLYHRSRINTRLQELIDDIFSYFTQTEDLKLCYIYRMGGLVHTIQYSNGTFSGGCFTNLRLAMLTLALKEDSLDSLRFDPEDEKLYQYNELYSRSRIGCVNVFINDQKPQTEITLFDECNHMVPITINASDMEVEFPRTIYSLVVSTYNTMRSSQHGRMRNQPMNVEWIIPSDNKKGYQFHNATYGTLTSIIPYITRQHRLPIKLETFSAYQMLLEYSNNETVSNFDDRTMNQFSQVISYLQSTRRTPVKVKAYSVFLTNVLLTRMGENDAKAPSTSLNFMLKKLAEDISTSMLNQQSVAG
ncbi:MAG: class I adenylate cyclase [Planctomycetes bacterium]|nr:class I adenylate cyclase [Planctomycetota bacterium]